MGLLRRFGLLREAGRPRAGKLAPPGRRARLRSRADGVFEHHAGGGRRLDAPHRATHHGLDHGFFVFPPPGWYPGGWAATEPALAVDRRLERSVPDRLRLPRL